MIASTTKSRAACVWMRLSFLLSFLLLDYLSLLTPSDLTYSPFPLHPTPLFPPPPLLKTLPPSCSISRCLMPLTGVAAPFFVRASAIQSGDGIKNQKVSLSKRHNGWCTLMSPWKFEIHMLSHFILFPLSPSFSHAISPSVFSFSSPSSCSSSPSSAIMYYSVGKRETKGTGKNVKCIEHGFLRALSCLLFFMF